MTDWTHYSEILCTDPAWSEWLLNCPDKARFENVVTSVIKKAIHYEWLMEEHNCNYCANRIVKMKMRWAKDLSDDLVPVLMCEKCYKGLYKRWCSERDEKYEEWSDMPPPKRAEDAKY